eukprot:1856735-Prymnesium_polylepis.1
MGMCRGRALGLQGTTCTDEWNPADQGAARARPNGPSTNRRPIANRHDTAGIRGNVVTVGDFGLKWPYEALAAP